MHCYESLYIMHPDLGAEGTEAAKARLEALVEEHGGRIYYRENWGNKRLAYDIAKQSKGNYQLLRFVGNAAMLAEMERMFRLDEAFLKFLTSRVNENALTVGTDAHVPREPYKPRRSRPRRDDDDDDEGLSPDLGD
ncbi:MAG: 30S ribosomal protein S6 [Nitrospirota bacterium]|nr:30S ribosomal protein S6 [Nitrospirota bacterium]